MILHLPFGKKHETTGVTIYRGRILDGTAREPDSPVSGHLPSGASAPGALPEPEGGAEAPVVLPMAQVPQRGETDAAQEILPREGEMSVRGRLPRLERFWIFLEAAGRGKDTITAYRWDAGWWERQARRRRSSVYMVRVGDVEAIIKGLHPATARRKLAFLRTLARWLLREGHPRLHTEMGKVTAPKLPRRLPGDKGAQAFVHLRAQARQWCREGKREGIWLGLMLMGGLRVSEIASAQPVDDLVKVVGKGVKERLVPLPSWLREAMAGHRRSGTGGWATGRHVIWKAMKHHQIGKPHALRHTYASELLRRGKPIEAVKVLLGHESISTTEIYARIHIPADAADLLDR